MRHRHDAADGALPDPRIAAAGPRRHAGVRAERTLPGGQPHLDAGHRAARRAQRAARLGRQFAEPRPARPRRVLRAAPLGKRRMPVRPAHGARGRAGGGPAQRRHLRRAFRRPGAGAGRGAAASGTACPCPGHARRQAPAAAARRRGRPGHAARSDDAPAAAEPQCPRIDRHRLRDRARAGADQPPCHRRLFAHPGAHRRWPVPARPGAGA